MKNNLVKFSIIIALVIISIYVLSSCSSKYARNLSMSFNEEQINIKVEEAKYIPGSVIANPYKEIKIKSGDGSMVTFVTGYRGKTMKDMTDIMIGFDKHIRHKIFFQLPAIPGTGTYYLKNRSFIQLLAHYELSESSKIFYPVAGFISIDSINGQKMFGTVRGNYENDDHASFDLNGNFTIKF